MAYDPIYRGMSPNAQIASAIATPLSQVLGGYLGAKLEESKLRREVESNKSVLGAIFSDLPPDELDRLSRVSPSQLNTVVEGLQSKSFKNIFNAGQGLRGSQGQAGIPTLNQLQQAPQMGQPLSQPLPQDVFNRGLPETQEMQNVQPEQDMYRSDVLDQLPRLSDTQKGGYTRTQVIDAAGQEAADIDAMQREANAANLTPQQRLQIDSVIAKRRSDLNDRLMNQEKLRLEQIDRDIKQEQKERDFTIREEANRLKREKFLQSKSDKERELAQKEIDRKNAEQAELVKEFGPGYNAAVNSEGALRAETNIFDLLDQINESKDSNFGFQLWTNVAGGFLAKKIADPTASLGTSNQIVDKLSNNLVIAQINKLSGKGLGPVKANMIDIIKKGGPSIYQSPQARGAVIKLGRISAKEELKKIQIQKKLYEENGGFVKNFNGIVENRMKPYYKKYEKQKKEVLKNIVNIAKVNQKRFEKRTPLKAAKEVGSSVMQSIGNELFSPSMRNPAPPEQTQRLLPAAGDFIWNTLGLREGISNIGSVLSSGAQYLQNRKVPPLAERLLFE